MDPQLEELLKEHEAYFEKTEDGKIKCLCNGHQFPARLDVIAPFIKGNKFATMRKRYDAEQGLQKYEPFIIQSKNFPHMLYCTLTGQLMDKSIAAVKVHMKGKKFQRNKELFAADKRELRPEPDIDTLMAEVMGRKASTKKAADSDDDSEAASGSEGGSEGGSDDEEMHEEASSGDEEMADAPIATAAPGKSAGKGKKEKAAGKEQAVSKDKAAGKGKAAVKAKEEAKPAVGVKRTRAGAQIPQSQGKKAAAAKQRKTAVKQGETEQGQAATQNGTHEVPPSKGGSNQADEEYAPEFWVPEEFADVETVAPADEDAAAQDESTEAAQTDSAGAKKPKQPLKFRPTVKPGSGAARLAAKEAAAKEAEAQKPAPAPAKKPVKRQIFGIGAHIVKRNASRASKAKKSRSG